MNGCDVQLPRRIINSNSASTSAMVMLTFSMPTWTPALMVTMDATSAERLISAERLSTSSLCKRTIAMLG